MPGAVWCPDPPRACICKYAYIHIYIYIYVCIYLDLSIYLSIYTYIWVTGGCLVLFGVLIPPELVHVVEHLRWGARVEGEVVEFWGEGVGCGV